MPSFKNYSLDERTTYLQSLMQGINARNGTVNCGRVALRLDEYLARGENLNLPPVATQSAKLFTQPQFVASDASKLQIRRSFTDNTAIIERCKPSSPTSTDGFDLTNETQEVIVLDIAAEIFTENKNSPNNIKLKKSQAADILNHLRAIPKRKLDGTAYGFMFYTWENNKVGHVTNFFVDEQDRVFFLDAQLPDPKKWVSNSLPSGYKPELFYLPSIPPEGFVLKKERGEIRMSYTNGTKLKYYIFMQAHFYGINDALFASEEMLLACA
jgi:hypothetical protein